MAIRGVSLPSLERREERRGLLFAKASPRGGKRGRGNVALSRDASSANSI